MKICIDFISGHKQLAEYSCVPMSVECVLKLLKLMKIDDFHLQKDSSKFGNSNWIKSGFSFPTENPRVLFSREFFLPDYGLKDRGTHFMQCFFEPLFNVIDNELKENRFVIISLQSAPTPTQWHMEVIFDKINDDCYQTLTFYFNNPNPIIYESQNLRQRVREMEGTDIITYKLF